MVVVGFHFGGWDIADLAVEAPVVEPFDVCQGGQLDMLSVAPGSLTFGQFGLVESVDRLGQGVDAPIDRQVDLGDFLEFFLNWWREQVVDLAGEVALEAPDDLSLGQPLFGSSFDVGDGRCVPSHSDDDRPVERCIGLAVAAAVEAVALDFAG